MLKKLYKHEFYSLFRSMIAVYIAIIGLALLGKISFLISGDGIFASLLKTSSTVLYIIGVIAMFVVGFVIVIVRFYKNLLSKEGYLTFTLPFTASQHLNCKLICGAAVIAGNFIVLILSLFIFFVGTDGFATFIDNIREGVNMVTRLYNPWQIAVVIAEFVAILLASLIQTLVMPYAAMSVGQRFKSKIGGAVLAYIIMYAAIETIDSVIMVVLMLLDDLFTETLTNYPYGSTVAIFGLCVLYSAVISSVMYLIARNQLTKHLNLE